MASPFRFLLVMGLACIHTIGAPGDEQWDDRFALPGIIHDGRAIAFDGNDLYVGGRFLTAGTIAVNHVARFDGTNWSPLGEGLTPDGFEIPVVGMTLLGSDLFVAGNFVNAGSSGATNIARWDGTQWYRLGEGIQGDILALTGLGSELFVGGGFAWAGGLAVSNIARWDGTQWSPVGEGLNGPVTGFTSVGSDLIAIGNFSTSGSTPVTNIARWDGSQWHALGEGLNPAPIATTSDATHLYAWHPSQQWPYNHAVSRWDGGGWTTIAGAWLNCNYEACRKVFDLAVFGGDIYVAGTFEMIGAVRANCAAKWNGTNWVAAGSGMRRGGSVLSAQVNALCAVGNRLFAAGVFDSVGGVGGSGVAWWDGACWYPVGDGSGQSLTVRELLWTGTNLLAGGNFESPVTPDVGGVGQWNGTTWSLIDGLASYGSGYGPGVSELVQDGTNLVVGGSLRIGAVERVGRWDGYQWWPLGNGIPGWINDIRLTDLALFQGLLFAGTDQDLRVWDGQQWLDWTSDISGSVSAFAVGPNDLHVAGHVFLPAAGRYYNLVRWDGLNWAPLPAELPGQIQALDRSGRFLFAAVEEVVSFPQFTNYVSRWDGTNWMHLGGVNGDITSLCLNGATLFVGGNFTMAGGVPASKIAGWNQGGWFPLGSGIGSLNQSVLALAASGTELFVAGTFSTAGGKPSSKLGLWHIPHLLAISRTQDDMLLRWPATGTNLLLETASDLGGTNWTAVTGSPVVIGEEIVASDAATSTQRFYRLRRTPWAGATGL